MLAREHDLYKEADLAKVIALTLWYVACATGTMAVEEDIVVVQSGDMLKSLGREGLQFLRGIDREVESSRNKTQKLRNEER
jgi:hypothetical protein